MVISCVHFLFLFGGMVPDPDLLKSKGIVIHKNALTFFLHSDLPSGCQVQFKKLFIILPAPDSLSY